MKRIWGKGLKFTIQINQKQVYEAGLVDETDLVDWAIIDYISKFYADPEAKFFDGHVWTNTKHLMNEMPLCKLNSKQAVSRRIKKLKDLGLITACYDDENKLYTKITKRCFEITVAIPDKSYNKSPKNRRGNQNATGGQSERNIKQTIS